jgi:hypothetical protein
MIPNEKVPVCRDDQKDFEDSDWKNSILMFPVLCHVLDLFLWSFKGQGLCL